MELITAGQRFGRWLILEDQKYTFVEHVPAQCECGTKRKVRVFSLRSGQSASCGCTNKTRLAESSYGKRLHQVNAGDVFGRLTVTDSSRYRAVTCSCSCGNQVTVRAAALYTGSTQSCGCLKKQIAHQMGMSRRTRNGQSRHKLFNTWRRIVIGDKPVHEPWRNDPELFIKELEDQLGPRPDDLWTCLHDPQLGYVPGNIFWGPRRSLGQRVTLTEAQRKDIAALVAAGAKQYKVAEQYQVSVSLVSSICRKYTT